MILSNMANVLRAAGLTVVEVPGWQTRGFLGRDLKEVRGVLWHHTVGPRTGNMPSLNVLINGRPDVSGPLSQLGLARDGTVYVIAAGLSNHAGAGSWVNIPKDMGNYYLIGIEMESAGTPPYDWTADQIRVAPHLGAALEKAYLMRLQPELRLQIGHLEYSSQGKIDPAGWPGGMNGLRNNINAVLNGDFEMAVTDQEMDQIAARVWSYVFKNKYGSDVDGRDLMGWIDKNVNDHAATLAKAMTAQTEALKEAIAGVSSPVVLTSDDVAAIAAALKESLAPGVVAELAKKLATE